MFTADLVDLLVERRRVVMSVEAECIELVGELVRRGGHEDLGYRSLVSLLTNRLGVSAGVARGMIRLAAALGEMPATRVALQLGVLDVPRVRMLVAAREVNPKLFADHESALVDTIEGLPMDRVSRVVDYWCQQASL